MSKTVKIIIGVIILGLIFFGGYEYGLSKKSVNQSFAGGNGRFGGNGSGRMGGGGMTAGDILSKDASGIVLSLRAGGSKIILVSTSTDVQKMAKGSLNDLLVGTSVSVSGATNADGSVTAQSIQIRPNFGQGQGQNQNSTTP